MYQLLKPYYRQLLLLSTLLLYSTISWAQAPNADLELDDRTQILVPPQGSTAQFCSSTGSNLTFRVVNRSSGAANVIDLNTNNLVATLTLTGNTFSPSGTVTSVTFSNATSSSATSTRYISATGFADFAMPNALQFNGTGTTTINVEVAVIGNTDAVSGNNSTTYQIEVLPNPTPPTITTNFGASLINICPSDTVIITSSPVGNEYEFYRNSVLLGPRQTSNVFTTNSLNDNDLIEVIAYFTNSCSSPSGSTLLVNVGTIPVGSLTSDAANNVACEGDDVLFTAGTGAANWFEFLVNNASQGASSTTSTFNLTNVTSDNIDVTVRSWTNSSSICYDEDTITIRLNSVSGVNQISNAQTICAGDNPAALISNSVFTADRAAEGATISYQWQSRTSITSFTNITGATSITYDPSSLSTTTFYRRLVYATFNGVQCQSTAPLAASNVVTITVNPNSFASLTLNTFNNTICDGADIIADASASTNYGSFLFYVNNNPYGSIQYSPTLTIPSSALSDNATITVQVFNGAGGTGCSSFANVVLRVNELTGNNTIGNAQTVCVGEIPSAFTNISTPTALRAGDGATLTFQWQSRPLGGTFNNILSATNPIYSPTAVSTSTEYRRLAISQFNSVSCTTTSNIVTVTVSGGTAPTVSLLSGNPSNVHCPTDNILLDASGTTGALSYAFTLNGIQQSGMPTTSAYSFSAGAVSDSDSVGVIAYSGAGGTGCSNTVTLTIRLNSITGTNTLGGAQTICSGDDPTQLTGSVASSTLGGSISYQWQSRTGTNTFVNIGGATGPNYDPPPVSVTTDFRRIVTSTVSGSTCAIQSSQVRVTTNPAPTVILNGGTTPVCTGDNVVFTASGGVFYEFFLDGVSMAASSTSNTISSTTFNDGEEVTVRVTDAQGCSATSTATTINVTNVPSAGITSGYVADTICDGEYPVFTATPADPTLTYSFYIDNIYQNLGVSTNTFDTSLATYTLLDNSVVMVVIENAAGCTSSATLTLRVLSTTGANTISGSQTICVGGDPASITSDAAPTAVASGSSISYQWQSKTNTGSFVDIPGATNLNFDPAPLSITTAFRRLAYVTLGSKTCPTPSNIASATSNVVTVTVDSSALPVISFVSGVTNDVMCEGDDLTFDASGTTGANSYEYFINGISQGPSSVATTLFVPSGTLSDTSTVRVHATSTIASPCFSSFTITMRVNSFNGTNSIGNGQTICASDDPLALTSLAVPSTTIPAANLTYQWQSRIGSNSFTDIASTNSIVYDPSLLATTTDFRRIARSEFNGVTCIDVSNFITIAVDPVPTATLVGSSTACIGDTVQFTASGGVTYEFFRNNISFAGPSASNVVTTTTSNGDQITVEVTNTNSCTALSSAITMSVSNPPAAAISSGLTADTMCEGDLPVFTASPAVAGYTYQFFINGSLQTSGVSTNTFDSSLSSTTLTDGAVILVQVTNTDGCSASASLTLRVNSLSGANTITGSQTICSGGDPTTLTNFSAPTADLGGATVTYQWQSRPLGGTFTDIPGATALTYDPPVLTLTTAYRRAVYATFNGVQCPSGIASASSNVVTITVDAASVPSVSFNSGVSNNTMCDGDTVVFDASGTTGASSYEFFIAGLSQGAPSAVATFTPIGALSDNATVTVRAYSSTVSNCFSDQTLTMRVIDVTTSNTVSSSQSICSGDTPAQLTGNAVSSNIVGVTYQWQSRIGANPFANIAGATTQNYTPTTGLATTTQFQRIAVATFNGVSCNETSNIITISVDPLPTASLIGTNTACVGDTVNFTATGGVRYEFFRNGASLGPASTTATLSRSDLVTGDQITVEVTNTNSCTALSSAITMSVSNPPAAAISSGLTADTMCEGDLPVFTASPAVAGYTYQFFINGSLQTSGVSTNTFDSSLSSTTLTDGAVILVQVTNTDGCSASASLTLRVNSLSGANTITGSQTICSGGDPTTLTNFSAPTADLGGATVTYQWQSRPLGGTFTDIPGATALTYDPPVLTLTTAYRRAVYATFNGVQCPSGIASASSNVVTITVDAASVPSVSFNSGVSNNTMCDGDTVVFDASGTTGASSYEFFIAGLSQGAPSAVATFSATPGSISNGDAVRVIAYSASVSGCTSEQTIIMTVNELTANTLDTATSSQTICAGDIPTQLTGPSVNGTPTNSVTYQWQSRQVSPVTNPFSNIVGATNQTYVFSSPLFSTTEFRRLAINTVNGVACTTESNVVTVTVSAGPPPPATLTSNQPANTGCDGDPFVFTASGAASSSFEFFVNNVSQGAPSSVNTISLSLTDSDTVRVDVYPQAGGVGCPSTVSVPVRVNTITGNNVIGGIQTICFGDDPAALSSINIPVSATGSITYQWQSRTSTGTYSSIAGATSPTYDPGTLNITTIFRRQVISTLNGIACSENSNTITITVDPTAIISGTLTSDQPSNTVCSNDPGLITFTASPGGAASYDFRVNGIVVQASSTVQTYTASITTFTDGDVVSVRFINASGCYSEESLTVNVNNISAGSISGAQSVCSGDTPLTLTSTASGSINGVPITSPGTGNYQWQSSTDGVNWFDIALATSDSYSPPAAPPPSTYYRRLTVNTLNGVTCSVPSNDVLVTVNALPVPGLTANPGAITAAATMSICASDTITFIGSGGVEYAFLVNNTIVQTRGASNTFVSSSLSNSDEITVIAYDSAAASACFDQSDAIEIVIAAAPVASLSALIANNTFCTGDNVTFAAGSGGVAATYEFKVNNTTYQNSASSTFDPSLVPLTLNGGDVIEVIVSSASSCTSVASLTLIENTITDVGTITSAVSTLCFGDVPSPLSVGTGVAAGAITYQWQQSFDNISYTDITGATSQNYTPTTGLSSTTFYRRTLISTLNTVVCSDLSLPFHVVVYTLLSARART